MPWKTQSSIDIEVSITKTLAVFAITMKRNLTTSFLQNTICEGTVGCHHLRGLKSGFVTPLHVTCCYLKKCWSLFPRSQCLKPDWFLLKKTPKGSWGRSEIFPLPVAVTLRQFHGMRQWGSDGNKTAFWFHKLNFSIWNLCKGDICLILFLGYFMPCPCICESHDAKKIFDSNKLERLKSW